MKKSGHPHFKIIHGLGHSVAPSTFYEQESALAVASTGGQDIIIPRNINSGTFATIVWDNNDFSEETISGKGTRHVANCVMNQKGSRVLKEKISVSKGVRTVKSLEPDIPLYSSKEK